MTGRNLAHAISNGLAEALAAAHVVTFTGSVEGLYACDLELFPGGNIDV